MKTPVFRVAIALATFVACSGDKDKTKGESGEKPAPKEAPANTTTNPTDKEPTKPDSPPEAAKAPIAKADIDILLKAWLDAQNGGEFEAYSATYAKRLTGIKRVGDKVKSFDREGWLKDRARMFRKPMKVEASNIEVRTNAVSATVKFTQNWSSASFQDTGAKQLLIVLDDKTLKIAREEMLSSTVLNSKLLSQGNLEGLYYRALDIDGFILGKSEPSWVKEEGVLSDASKKPPYIATQTVDTLSLPDNFKNLVGSSVKVYGEDGVCEDTIKDLRIVSGNTPHFSYFQDENAESVKVSDTKLGLDIPDMSTGYLMAITAQKCDGPILQLKGETRKYPVAALVEDKEAAAKAWAAFEKNTEYKKLQKEYDADEDAWNGKTGTWHAPPAIRVFDDKAGKRKLIVIGSEGGYGCGGFYGTLGAVYQIDSKGKLSEQETLSSMIDASMALDLTGDGQLDFLGFNNNRKDRSVLLGSGDKGLTELHAFAWDYQDCDC